MKQISDTPASGSQGFRSRRWLIDDFSPAPRRQASRAIVAARGVHKPAARTQRLRLVAGAKPQPVKVMDVRAPRPNRAQRAIVTVQRVPQTSQVSPVRSQLAKPEAVRLRSKPAKRRRAARRARTMVITGVMLLIIGLGLTAWALLPEYKENQTVAQAETQNLDEAPPSTQPIADTELASYQVAAEMPRYLDIEKLSVHARVMSLGLTRSGAVASPRNVHDVGWYSGSALPGATRGAAFIDGHVSSYENAGVFKELNLLANGDIVSIELGNGSKVRYQVVKTEALPVAQVDMQAALSPINPEKPGLNLMTCHGSVAAGTSEFTQRFIVYTEQI